MTRIVHRPWLAIAALLLGLAPQTARAENFGGTRLVQVSHTWPVTQSVPSLFGDALGLSSTFAAVGAPEAEVVEGLLVGAVVLYESKESSLSTHSVLYGAIPAGSFGSSLALDPPLLAVGAATSQELKVFRYDGDSWESEATLTKPGLTRFAGALALDQTSLVVGSTNPQGVGWVTSYHFEGTWIEDPPVVGKAVGGRFGSSLALDGDLLAIGATNALVQGRVYFATREGTVFTLDPTPLVPDENPEALDFGASIALSGDGLLAVGAPGSEANRGAVLVYHQNDPENPSAWSLLATLRPPDGTAPRFGASLAFSEGSLLVGAPAEGKGRIYIYNSPEKALDPPSLTLSDIFQPEGASYGLRLATSGRRALIGAPAPGTVHDGDVLSFDLLYAQGNACDDNLLCASDHCVDGLCCNTSCDALCERCAVEAGAAEDGICGPLLCDEGLICVEAENACGVPPEETTGGETTGLETTGGSTSGTATSGGIPSLDLDPFDAGCACRSSDGRDLPIQPALASALLLLALRRRKARS